MVRFTFQVEDQLFDRGLTRLVSRTRDFSEVFRRIGEDFRDVMKEQFDAEGYGWEKLSTRYRVWKDKHFPGKTILRREDKMYNAMTRKGAAGNVNRVSATEAAFGAEGEPGRIAHFHQIGAGRLPVRKVVYLRESDKRLFTKTMHEYMLRLGSEAGFEISR